MVKDDGSRRACLPLDVVLGRPVALSSRDTVVCAGAGWVHNDIAAIVAAKQKLDFRLVTFCYDIIPLMFPHFFLQADTAAHRDYFRLAFPAADLVIVSSPVIEADVRAYCAAHALALHRIDLCPMGGDFPLGHGMLVSKSVPTPGHPMILAGDRSSRVGKVPMVNDQNHGARPLEAERYALLVGTIEPRKGHRMIYRAWLKLLEAGVPQRHRFKLVFAGREGWMVGDLLHELRNDRRLANSLVLFTHANDADLAALYRDAAFCLHPSRYEGYGLPIIEAFHHGKAILASTGGAAPDAVGELSPCLDPNDIEAWTTMLQTWIERPVSRFIYEEKSARASGTPAGITLRPPFLRWWIVSGPRPSCRRTSNARLVLLQRPPA